MVIHPLIRKLDLLGYCNEDVQAAFSTLLARRQSNVSDVLDNEENLNAVLDILYGAQEGGCEEQCTDGQAAGQGGSSSDSEGGGEDYDKATDSQIEEGTCSDDFTDGGSELDDSDLDVQVQTSPDVSVVSHHTPSSV